jgi:hypothetical protein
MLQDLAAVAVETEMLLRRTVVEVDEQRVNGIIGFSELLADGKAAGPVMPRGLRLRYYEVVKPGRTLIVDDCEQSGVWPSVRLLLSSALTGSGTVRSARFPPPTLPYDCEKALYFPTQLCH